MIIQHKIRKELIIQNIFYLSRTEICKIAILAVGYNPKCSNTTVCAEQEHTLMKSVTVFFWAHSVKTQWTLREHSESTQRLFRDYSEIIQRRDEKSRDMLSQLFSPLQFSFLPCESGRDDVGIVLMVRCIIIRKLAVKWNLLTIAQLPVGTHNMDLFRRYELRLRISPIENNIFPPFLVINCLFCEQLLNMRWKMWVGRRQLWTDLPGEADQHCNWGEDQHY